MIISQGIKENGLKRTRGKSLIVSCLGAAFPVDPYFFYRHGSGGILTVRDQHGYQKPAGLSAGLPGVGVRVWCLYPTQNPYPSTGWRVWSGIQTPLEKRDQRVSLLCWHLCHTRKWDIHARFRVFLPLLSTITTSAHQMDTLTTLKSQNRATTGRMGEAHPFSQ